MSEGVLKNNLIPRAVAILIRAANFIFMACTQGGSKRGKFAVNVADKTAVDETAAAVEPDIFNTWKARPHASLLVTADNSLLSSSPRASRTQTLTR